MYLMLSIITHTYTEIFLKICCDLVPRLFFFCLKLHAKPDVMTVGGGGNYIHVRECNE